MLSCIISKQYMLALSGCLLSLVDLVFILCRKQQHTVVSVVRIFFFLPKYLVTFEHISSVNLNIVLNTYNSRDRLLNKCKPEEFTNSASKQMLERHPVVQNSVCRGAYKYIYIKRPVFNVSRSEKL